jgi:adenylate cyclase
MFTDMVGYTALGQKNEELSLALVEEQRKLVRPILERHGGREVKTIGDAFMVEFTNSLEAVRCAYDIQRATREFNFSVPEKSRVRLRIGIHLGDVVDTGGDISGDAVNVASRIEALAEDGGACVTREVYVQVENKVEIPLKSIGTRSLKNVVEPVEVYKLVMPWDQMLSSAELDQRRVAVLPFANYSPDPGDEYFSDGMTEELIDRLAQVKSLKVIARTSVMNYKKKEKNVSDIAKELSVGSIVEGSVRKAANKVRITVQLINARDESHLWAASYDRTLEDIFTIQSDVAARVADSLSARVLAAPKKDTEDVQAYTWYLRATQLMHEISPENQREAVTLLEKATSKDPQFVRAFATLAHAYGRMATNAEADLEVATNKAEVAARRALEIDPDSAEAHAAMSEILVAADKHAEAIEEAQTAIRINPNLSVAHLTLGTEHLVMGNLQDATESFRRACELDPLSTLAGGQLADALFYSGRKSEAFDVAERLRELTPESPMPYVELALLHMYSGEFTKARELLDTARGLSPNGTMPRIAQGLLFALMGDRKRAEELLGEFAGYRNDFMRLLGTLWVTAALGEKDLAFDALMQMADKHLWASDVKYVPMLGGLEGVRNDPRFADFCRKVGIPP